MFSNITKYQVHVENSARIAELTSRALNRAMQANGPTQLNYSRNIFGDVHGADTSRKNCIQLCRMKEL